MGTKSGEFEDSAFKFVSDVNASVAREDLVDHGGEVQGEEYRS